MKGFLIPFTDNETGEMGLALLFRHKNEMLLKASGSGERWITVHPSGSKDDRGIPVLIRESSSQPGIFHIIGGAGGKLNMLKLTNVRSEAEYKEQAKTRAAEKREEEKKKKAENPEQFEQEQEAKTDVKLERRQKEREFIDHVAETMGWENYDLKEESLNGLTEGAKKVALYRHHLKLLKRAKEVVGKTRRRLLLDHELAVQNGLGEISLKPTSEDEAAFADLDPDKPGSGLGYQRNTRKQSTETIKTGELIPEKLQALTGEMKRAAQQAMEQDSEMGENPVAASLFNRAGSMYQVAQRLQESGQEDKAAEIYRRAEHTERKAERRLQMSPEGAMFAQQMEDRVRELHEEVRAAKDTGALDEYRDPETDALTTDQAKDLLIAERKLRKMERDARQALHDIETGVKLGGDVFSVMTDEEADEKVEQEAAELLRETKARSFLEEIETDNKISELLELTEREKKESMVRHVAAGAYNAVNNTALTLLKDGVIERDVADTLGIAGTARLLAYAIREAYSPEQVANIQNGLAEFHTSRHNDLVDYALQEANTLQEEAERLEVESIEDPVDLVQAQTFNEQRRALLSKARELMGGTLGELESYAAIQWALKQKSSPQLTVSLGNVTEDTAMAQARAIGLTRAEFHVVRDGDAQALIINSEGLKKLVGKADPERIQLKNDVAAIKAGQYDEEGWLPEGVAARPATTFDDPKISAAEFSAPIDLKGKTGADFREAIEDYVAARAADGVPARNIWRAMTAMDFRNANVSAEQQEDFNKIVDELFPPSKLDNEETESRLQQLAQGYVQANNLASGADNAALHSQGISVGTQTLDAAHRALCDKPYGTVAFKGVGELNTQEQAVLRDYFYKQVKKTATPQETRKEERTTAKESGAKAGQAAQAGQALFQTDLFGGMSQVVEQPKGEAAGDAEKRNEWDEYVHAMGGLKQAYGTMQELIRGDVMEHFATHYGRVYGRALKTGKSRLPHYDRHLIAIMPEEQKQRIIASMDEKMKSAMAKLAQRDANGRYLPGARKQMVEMLMEAQRRQAQMALFGAGADEMPNTERLTIGRRAENQLKSVFGQVSRNFNPKKPPVALWSVSMSGKYVKQQRAIKALERRKHMGLFFGTGSGKTYIQLGAFAHLHSQGKVQRGIYVVPSAVQAQFGEEAVRLFEPGKFRWFADPSASSDERRAAYKDPNNHMLVVTHQSFRDDMLNFIADEKGVSFQEADKWFEGLNRAQRADALRSAMRHSGINFQMMAVDEGHEFVNRKGKENSQMSNIHDALADSTEYAVFATGTPVKNDPSEAYDWASKVDPQRYPPEKRDDFLRRYGINTVAASEALHREFDDIFFSEKISSGVQRTDEDVTVELTPEQQQAYKTAMDVYNRARLARDRGEVDVEAIKVLSPSSFKHVPVEQHKELAGRLCKSLGIIKESALARIEHTHEWRHNAKILKLVDVAKEHMAKGEPGVVFAHNRETVKQVAEALKTQGFKVGTLTGADSADEKAKRRLEFQPESGEAKTDILIVSDAGSAGLNLQRGKWLYHVDIPDTAKTHEQRSARIDRLGQKAPVKIYTARANTRSEQRRHDRLKRKYALANVFQSPSELMDDTGLAHFINKQYAQQKQAEV